MQTEFGDLCGSYLSLAVLHQIKFSMSDCKVQDHQVMRTHSSSPAARKDGEDTCIMERQKKVKNGLRVLNYKGGHNMTSSGHCKQNLCLFRPTIQSIHGITYLDITLRLMQHQR